jgi:hypothetical protein
MSGTLPVANAIWIGSELGPIQTACLRSFLRVGHRTVLHCYRKPIDVPKGVELADAAKLLPESQLIRHKESGSYALFSDLLRYKLLREGLGLYVDCDILCIRPIKDEEFIFGWSTPKAINGAVLKLPAGSPILADLCKINDGFIPPWSSVRYRLRMRLCRMLGATGPTLEELPWGSAGPTALTWYAKHHGIDHLAKSKDVFYPLGSKEMALLFDPNRTIDDLITPRTATMHLYNEYFKRRSLHVIPIPPSSPLGRMIAAN